MPAPAVANDLSVKYTPPGISSVTVGGASGQYLLVNKIVIDKTGTSDGVPTCAVECEVLANDTSEAQFAAYCSTLETAFSTPRGAMVVKLGATELLNLDPANNTGFDADVSCSKPGNDLDTARSRYYRLRLTFKLPAKIAANEGRVDSKITLEFSTSKVRGLTVEGTYTALSANAASTQYTQKIGAYVGTIQQALTNGSIWKTHSEKYTRGETDKVLNFTHVSRELIFGEKDGTGVTADPDLVQTNLTIERTDFAPGDSFTYGAVTRLQDVGVSYATAVDKNATTDLVGKYASSIRPWIIKNVQAAFPGALALVEETDPQIDPVNNVLGARMRFLVSNGGKLLGVQVTTTDDFDFGALLTAVWARNPLTKDFDQGPQTKTRTIARTRRLLGTYTPGQGPGGVGEQNGGGAQGPSSNDGVPRGRGAAGGGGGGQFPTTQERPSSGSSDPSGSGLESKTLRTSASATPLRLGLPGYQIDVTDMTDLEVIAFYVPAGVGAAPDNSSGGSTRTR